MKKLFFWDANNRPQNFVKNDIPADRKLILVGILTTGEQLASYRGIALCRMPNCGKGIGSADHGAHGFMWPSNCEHYVLEHNVWPPGCDELIDKVLKAIQAN